MYVNPGPVVRMGTRGTYCSITIDAWENNQVRIYLMSNCMLKNGMEGTYSSRAMERVRVDIVNI